MRKVKFLVLAVLVLSVFVLGLTACNAIKSDDSHEESTTQSPELVTDGNDTNSVEKVLLSNIEKQAVYNGTYGEDATDKSTYYGVGRTINVITDKYITVRAGYTKVFDAEKLLDLNWVKTYCGQMESYSVYGNSMEETYNNFNQSVDSKVNIGLDIPVFSANLEFSYGQFNTAKLTQASNEVYYSSYQNYYGTLIEIDEYYDINQFRSILSEELLSDIENLSNGNISAAEFILKYGTHVVLAGYYGGRIEANYYMQNSDIQWSKSQEKQILANIGTCMLKLVNAGVSLDYSILSEIGVSLDKVTEEFSASSIGGANFKATTIKDYLENYGVWVDSMNSQKEYSNIVGLPARSLVAIWDLFPSKYIEAKKSLCEYFENSAGNVSNEFLAQYEKHYTEPIIGDTINFGGGLGSQNSPYLIKTKEHFANIQSLEYAGKYFKLDNSIDLGIWNAPFNFTGHFDGNGKQITYYQTLGVSGNQYGGLFSSINNSTINNLYIDAYIAEENKSGHSTAYVGLLSGKVIESEISKISTSGIINLANGEGTDYIGGIVGYFTGGTIDQCKNSATVESHAYQSRTGGIIGYACANDKALTVSNCYNEGQIKACTAYIWGGRSSGGIVGQVRGHSTFTLSIKYSYNNGNVSTLQEKNAALGWWGCGGIFGDIEEKYKNKIEVSNSYWNTSKSELYGNNGEFHGNETRKTVMTGNYANWQSEIWIFSNNASPKLRWLI